MGMLWMLCILPTIRYMSASHRTTVSVRFGTHDRQIRSGRPRRRMRRSNRFKLPYLLRRPAHPTTSSFSAPSNHYLILLHQLQMLCPRPIIRSERIFSISSCTSHVNSVYIFPPNSLRHSTTSLNFLASVSESSYTF